MTVRTAKDPTVLASLLEEQRANPFPDDAAMRN
jgi:hypothetical protein